MPWPPSSPARISPLSLSRTRWKRAAATAALVLAETEAREAPDDDVLAGLRTRFLDQVADRLLVVLDVRLLEQAHLGEELVDLPVDDLVEDVGRLVLAFELGGEDRTLARDPVGRHVLAAHVVGAGGRDLHGEITHPRSELRRAGDEVGLAVDLDQHAHP